MSQHDVNGLPVSVTLQLQAMINRVRALVILRGIMATLAVSGGTMLAVMGIELMMPRISELARWLLTLLIPMLAGLSCWRYLVRPLRRRLTFGQMARIVEARHPELQERLSSTVELAARSRQAGESLSPQLLEALARESVTDVSRLNPGSEFSFALIKRWGIAPAVCLGILVLATVLWPKGTLRLFVRSMAPSAELGNLYSGRMTVRPGAIRIAAGDPLTLEMMTTDPALKPVYLECRTTRGKTAERMSLMTDTNETTLRYRLTLSGVTEPFTYRVAAGYAESDRYQVLVEPRPALTNLQVRYRLPAYTGMDFKVETNSSGNIRAIAGTEVTIEARPTKALSKMILRVGTLAPAPGRDVGIAGAPIYSWTLNLNTNLAGPYTYEMRDAWGFSGEPVSRMIEVVPDEPPSVSIVAPESETLRVKPSELVNLVAVGQDDFGIGRAELLVTVDSDPQTVHFVEGLSPVKGQPGVVLVKGLLDLSRMKLAGRTRIKVVVRVYDNRSPEFGGGQSAVSSSLTLELDQTAKSLVRQALEAQLKTVHDQVAALSSAIHDAAKSAREADQKFKEQKGSTPEAMAAVDKTRDQTAMAEAIAQTLANAIRNTPMAAMLSGLDNLMANNLTPARQAADTLPLAESANQAPLADQMAQSLNSASFNVGALEKKMESLDKQVKMSQAQSGSGGGGGGNQGSDNASALASLGMLGYSGDSSLNWTKAKGLTQSKVGGDSGLRVPPEYREIVGRYFEELSRSGHRDPVNAGGQRQEDRP